jgi:transposase
MENDIKTLQVDLDQLKNIIEQRDAEIEILREQISHLYNKLFGKKSEKGVVPSQGEQLPLFDMPEPDPEDGDDSDDTTHVDGHERKKTGRKKLSDSLPRIEVIHDIPEEDKTCGCGHMLSQIDAETSEKLDIIPAIIRVIRHIRLKYACKHCEGVQTNGSTVKIAPPPKQIINKGIVSAGLLAHIVIAKFCDALPFYRQEKQFERLGVSLPRATMSNNAMKAANQCQPLIELLESKMRAGPLINIDETSLQVLKEPNRKADSKSYMWVRRGGEPGKPVYLYNYAIPRSGAMAKELLAGFSGIVQSDGFAAYAYLDSDDVPVHHVGCWAHARRYFFDAQKAGGKKKKPGSADVALKYIRNLYLVEKEAKSRNLSAPVIVELRQEHSKPILDTFHKWLLKKHQHVTPKSLLGKAVTYCLNQWYRLTEYINHGEVTPDNNLAENAIRPFVIGRKNWLFAGSPKGAHASATLYSLVETAKANNLDPYRYLRFIFEKLPFAEVQEDYQKLLPMHLTNADLEIEGVSGV